MSNWSRKELLEWLNSFFEVNIPSVQHLNTGALYIQILDSIWPGQVDMDKIDWYAETEYDAIKNLKVLQNVMTRHRISSPPINFETLAKGQISENLEVLRFLKNFWDANFRTEGYDPVARRNECMVRRRKSVDAKSASRRSTGNGGLQRRTSGRSRPSPRGGSRQQSFSSEFDGQQALPPSEIPSELLQGYSDVFNELDTSGSGLVSFEMMVRTLGLVDYLGTRPAGATMNLSEFISFMADPQTDLTAGRNQQQQQQKQHQQMKKQRSYQEQPTPPQNNAEIQQLREQLEEEMRISKELESERDFYYNKLRTVEELCQDVENTTSDPKLLADIFEILWKPREQ